MAEPARKLSGQTLLDEALNMGIDIDGKDEQQVREALSAAQSKEWQIENKDAIESYNRYVEEHGLPLEKYRP